MIQLFISLFISLSIAQNFSVMDDLDGTSSHIDGPNCWNGALVASGVLESKRFINPKEWLYHIEKNCHEVTDAFSGALGRIYHPENGEVHGFIHLSDNLIFAKHGEDDMHGYQYMSYNMMLDQYGRTRRCRVNDDFSDDCFHKIKYYDCQSKSEFPNTILKVNKLFEDLLFLEQTKKKHAENCDSQSFIRRSQILDEIIINLEEYARAAVRLPKELEAYLSSSYMHQVYNIEVSNRYYRCEDRIAKNEKTKALRYLLKEVFVN